MSEKVRKPKEFYVEFGGDPSDDKELYKRYSSTVKFEASSYAEEVIHLVEYSEYVKAIDALKAALKTMQEVDHQGVCAGGLKNLLQAEIEFLKKWLEDV